MWLSNSDLMKQFVSSKLYIISWIMGCTWGNLVKNCYFQLVFVKTSGFHVRPPFKKKTWKMCVTLSIALSDLGLSAHIILQDKARLIQAYKHVQMPHCSNPNGGACFVSDLLWNNSFTNWAKYRGTFFGVQKSPLVAGLTLRGLYYFDILLADLYPSITFKSISAI